VGPRRNFWNHPAEAFMEFVLRGNDRRQHFEPIGHNCRGRFITSRFDREKIHPFSVGGHAE
jgi:hypothetical protein